MRRCDTTSTFSCPTKINPKVECVTVQSDANWAGCRDTRKSTSGGCILLGQHLINTWSKTQHAVATPIAENEGITLVKATSEGIEIARIRTEWESEEVSVMIWANAKAALGIIERNGVGKVRHIDVGILWLQQKMAQ